MKKQQITVTSSLLPSLEELNVYLQDIRRCKWIINNGYYHQIPEAVLCEYLDVPHIGLSINGALPLTAVLLTIRITGKVITTPFSSVATTRSLWLNSIKPVFVDVDPVTCNLDPDKIEVTITPDTITIMPVCVYGYPCDAKSIRQIADKCGLRVIHDTAHAFGVGREGESILNAGDMSTLSFHVMKAFSTIRGSALVLHDEHTKKRVDYLKNLGFVGEIEAIIPGTNDKLDEVQAVYELLNLKQVDAVIEARYQAITSYREALHNVPDITLMDDISGMKYNYSYFLIFVDEERYGMSRDELYFKIKEYNVLGRRYSYPLISTSPTYRELKSARKENLPVATKMVEQVICLPMHHTLSEDDMG